MQNKKKPYSFHCIVASQAPHQTRCEKPNQPKIPLCLATGLFTLEAPRNARCNVRQNGTWLLQHCVQSFFECMCFGFKTTTFNLGDHDCKFRTAQNRGARVRPILLILMGNCFILHVGQIAKKGSILTWLTFLS